MRDEIGIHVRKRMTHEKFLHNLNKKHVIFQKKLQFQKIINSL